LLRLLLRLDGRIEDRLSNRMRGLGHIHSNVRNLVFRHFFEDWQESLHDQAEGANLRELGNSEQGDETVQIVGVRAHVQHILNNVLLGPFSAKDACQFLEIFQRSLSNAVDRIREPLLADVH